MEVLVKLALQKYSASPAHIAVKKFADKSFLGCYASMNSCSWRMKRYWTEEVDNVIK
jgi:hypothetical protein